jgi:hypothetical protein
MAQKLSKDEAYKTAVHNQAIYVMRGLDKGREHVMYTLNLLGAVGGEGPVSHDELAKIIKTYGLNTDVQSYVDYLCHDLKIAINTGEEVIISPTGKTCLRYEEAQRKSGIKLF